MNIDWNVKEYLKDFAFVPKYGEAVLDMIDAAPGTLAVDLGCGNGGLTGKAVFFSKPEPPPERGGGGLGGAGGC